MFFLLYGDARSLNYSVWLHFLNLPPFTKRENHLKISYGFCRWRESNPGNLRSKRVHYPLLHCLSAATAMLKRSFYLVFDKQSIAKASVDWNWWTQLGSVTSSLNFLLGQQSFGPSTTLFGINALFCCEEQIYNFLKPISEKQEKEQKSLFQQLSFLSLSSSDVDERQQQLL